MRRGASLVELLVALLLGAVVLAFATGSLLRQQRVTAALSARASAARQFRAGAALLASQLALQGMAGDDIVAGEARDTSLQLRVPIAAGIACDSGSTLRFDIVDQDGGPVGVATSPEAGDSLWWYQPDSARWTGRKLSAAWSDVARCAATERAGAPPAPRRTYQLRAAGVVRLPALSPLRITRASRISVYRASDGRWQLGLREWSDVLHGLTPPQPVAGPFLRTADARRTGFRYFDAHGKELMPAGPLMPHARIARVRLTMLASAGVAGMPPVAVASDSIDVAIRQGRRE